MTAPAPLEPPPARSRDWVAASIRYPVEHQRRFSLFLLASATAIAAAAFLARWLPAEPPPKTIEVDLGVDASPTNDPPPLGEPDAGAGEKTPDPVPVPPAPVTPPPELVTPDPPPPEPIPEPPKPQFIVPEERPIATPRPRVAAATPREHPHHTAVQPSAASTSTGDGALTGNPGTRGSPGGQAGGHGGGPGDFTSTPQPQYDEVARQRGYQGRGTFIIHYQNGIIVGVSIAQSTGIAYLDARTTSWISARWRVKPGVSGTASLPVTWQLR